MKRWMERKEFFTCFPMDAKRAFFSIPFLISILCIFLALVSTGSEELIPGLVNHTSSSAIYYFQWSMSGVTVIAMAAIAYSTSFCSDWKNGFTVLVIGRSNPLAYSLSKVMVSYAAGAGAYILGCFLYLGVLCVFFPFSKGSGDIGLGGFYTELLAQGKVIIYLNTVILIGGLQNGLYSALAMFFSFSMPNVFVIISAPVLTYYFIANVFDMIHPPFWIDLWGVYRAGIFHHIKGFPVWANNLYIFGFTTIVVVALGLAASKILGKRLGRD